MIKHRRTHAVNTFLAGTGVVVAAALAGCSAGAAEEPAELSDFGSIEELSDAVSRVLDCEPESGAEPVTLMFDGYLPEYAMCSDSVQLVRYENQADRAKVSDMLPNSQNGPEVVAEGGNWHVLVLPTGEAPPTAAEMENLADQLGGRYITVAG
ncbi:hypothetical protein [Arthrobacter sp.]|uniref:hypothetical protein n=1 Tax=Arthrobacter sp. TaxID=1667 RepID=UPI0028A29EDF|nr:hypothetical protein [Arthrobacter sp.]